MPNYRRSYQAGGTFFITLVTYKRQSFFTSPLIRSNLKQAIAAVKLELPFSIPAQVLLPDHWHLLMTLPVGDFDYSKRIGKIKALTTKLSKQDSSMAITDSIWQKRFWEHQIRDNLDFNRHIDYIHINPVKHGLVDTPEDWPFSTYHNYKRDGLIEKNWGKALELEGNFGE